MNILGIEFNSNNLNYVLIDSSGKDYRVLLSNKLILGDTRSRDSLIAFQNAIKTVFNSAHPDLIAIKEKPESGQLRAGAAALKMEGITIANSPCQIDFVSGARINRCDIGDQSIHVYLQPALKAAIAASIKVHS